VILRVTGDRARLLVVVPKPEDSGLHAGVLPGRLEVDELEQSDPQDDQARRAESDYEPEDRTHLGQPLVRQSRDSLTTPGGSHLE